MNEINIHTATPEHAKELLEIYAPYIQNTAITFEYEVPEVKEFAHRIESTLEKYPYLIAECNGQIIGYAYTHTFIDRAAYDWSVATSIYVKQDCKKQGVGKKLYEALEEISKAQNILNMNACITVPEKEDQYLTRNSIEFHTHMGYRKVGEFYKCGYKFNRWYNMMWMEKIIGHHKENHPDMIPFPRLEAFHLKYPPLKVSRSK